MFTKSQMNSVPQDVALVMQELNHEEAVSNLNQAKIGRRVHIPASSLEKIVGFSTPMIAQKIHPDTGEVSEPEADSSQEDCFVSRNEPIRYRIAKSEENGYKRRE